MTLQRISPGTLRAELAAGGELALVDVREERPFGEGHILVAVRAGLGRLEIDLPRLVPCRHARVVLCDGGEGLAERAAAVAAAMGYRDLAVLDGGTAAWLRAGGRLFTGLNAPGAALAETVDLVCRPPRIEAAELDARRRAGETIVVLDSRPWGEFLAHHIPGGIDCPGGELIYRARDLAPDPSTPVVVNCAGRSRSLYGAWSLIAAGLPNPVYSLADGTYGWAQAGLPLERGPGPRADTVSATARAWSADACAGLARRSGVVELDGAGFATWLAEHERRPLYLLDVRSPEEYAAGHVAGAVSAPGGQLVECADDWIGVRNARIVLLDDDGVRARASAFWLRQLLYPKVAVLAPDVVVPRDETRLPPVVLPDVPRVAPAAVAAGTAVLDLSSGPAFRRGHVPGAVWALRSRLPGLLAALPAGPLAVMDDASDVVAAQAVGDLAALGRSDASLLPGGLDAWCAAGGAVATGEDGMLTAMDDVYYLPADMVADAMSETADYLAWQAGLVEEVAADGLLSFAPLGRN